MSGKKKAALVAVIVAILGVVAFAIGGGAVTSAGGTLVERHVTVTDLGDGYKGVDITNDNRSSVIPLGDVQLVESATNTKTYVTSNGVGCGNVSMNYSRPTTSSATYTVSKMSSWRTGSNCGNDSTGVRGSVVNVKFVANDGTQSNRGVILMGETDAWFRISTGNASTKAQWERQDMTPSADTHVSCGALAPGGAGGWYRDTACV